MIGFYFGGLVALAVMITADAIGDGQAPSWGDYLGVVLWPVTMVWFLIDAIRGAER